MSPADDPLTPSRRDRMAALDAAAREGMTAPGTMS